MAYIDHHLLMALMDTTPDRIYFKDLQGRFISVNQATRLFHGTLNTKPMEGLTDFDFFLPEHANEAYADEQRIIATGKPLVHDQGAHAG